MKRLLLKIIRFYQKHISPHTPPTCRYMPTCSEYAKVAIDRWGALFGGMMALKRILRCHPLHEGGYDPVPELPESEIRRD